MVQTSLQLKILLTDGLIHVVILNTVKSIAKKGYFRPDPQNIQMIIQIVT